VPRTSKVRIRYATLDDLDVLVHQRRGMWEDMEVPGDYDAADRAYRRWARTRLKSGRLIGILAEVGGRAVCGACIWLQDTQPRPHVPGRFLPYLMSMYTEPEFRRRGIATRVVREVIRWSRAHGYPRLVLHASDEGRPLYEKLGFEPTREMRLRLRPRSR